MDFNDKLFKTMLPFGEITEDVIRPSAQTLGTILDNVLYLIFGGFAFQMDMKRIEREAAKKAFRKDCEERFAAIPEENLRTPSDQMLASALLAADTCVGEETLHDMFATLLTSSFDRSKRVHPRYPELLHSMTSQDAKLLHNMVENFCLPSLTAFPGSGFQTTMASLGGDKTTLYTTEILASLNLVAKADQKVADRTPEHESLFEAGIKQFKPQRLEWGDEINTSDEPDIVRVAPGFVYPTTIARDLITVCFPSPAPSQ